MTAPSQVRPEPSVPLFQGAKLLRRSAAILCGSGKGGAYPRLGTCGDLAQRSRGTEGAGAVRWRQALSQAGVGAESEVVAIQLTSGDSCSVQPLLAHAFETVCTQRSSHCQSRLGRG